MKMTNWLLALLMLTHLAACSSSDGDSEELDGEEISEVDDSEFELEDDSLSGDESETLADEENIEIQDEALVVQDVPQNSLDEEPVVINGEMGTYTVQPGETLMLIAFKLFGDHSKWRELASRNPGVDSGRLASGMQLKYSAPAQPFVWNPKGNPHLIKTGETLGTISKDKYGTAAKWKDIYDNNRPMIKNPNLIFAGFTLYWLSERDLASQ